ncbi:MAG TPA: hypothetical protein VGW39_08140 [Chthoniobacterales bacterium]|nr:hypothetical protein [Chthoniobacterales bacterium]
MSTLQSTAYSVAEFHLANGTRVRIPMADMRRALSSASIRNNRMVGPFNVNPLDRTVNGYRVSMEVIDPSGGVTAERQIPTSVTAELLNEDGSFIEFGAFLTRYRRPALSDDDLRAAYRALCDIHARSRNARTDAAVDGRLRSVHSNINFGSPSTAAIDPHMQDPASVADTSPPDLGDRRSTSRGEFLKAGGAAAIGGLAALAGTGVTGAMGLSVAGTAVAVGAAPVAVAGAIVGLAGYGVYRAIKG